jgi:Transposase DDE domain
MVSITGSVACIKDNPLGVLDRTRIEEICREHHLQWRNRELDPATTIGLFVQQIAAGNCPCSEVRHLPGNGASFTAQAYCAARARIPLAVYQSLLSEVTAALMPLTGRQEHLWNGHRTFHIDGSAFSMPDTPELQKAFGMPPSQKPGIGFPVAHLLVVFSASTGLLLDAWAAPLRTGDVAQTPEAHVQLQRGDVLIGDDAFSGFPHLAGLIQQGLHGLFPVHHKRIVDFTKRRPHSAEGKNAVAGMPRSRWISSLGRNDQLVEYFKPNTRAMSMTQEQWDALPESITVREIRRKVSRPGRGKITVTLVTTLLDPKKYPAAELLDLRLSRWTVETDIRHLKTTMKMDVLHCQSEAGVRKELAIFALVYNLVRAVMLEAADRQGVPLDRISFADTYKWLRHARPGDILPPLIVNRHRPNRVEPRCLKRRPKPYDLMTKPRKELKKELRNKAKIA